MPSAETFYDEWTVVKCGICEQYVIKDTDSDEAIVAVRSELNTAHCKLFDATKEAMTPCDALSTLLVGDTALARVCTKYDRDTKLAPDIFKNVNDKVKLLPDMLPAVALLRAAFNQQGSTSASSTSSAFRALTNGIRENESMTAIRHVCVSLLRRSWRCNSLTSKPSSTPFKPSRHTPRCALCAIRPPQTVTTSK